jgi:RNA polymerase I-specific transcription initiation factor RRN3
VLNTHRSKYTQFLVFFLCAQDSAHADQFLGYLHQLLFDPKVAVLTRRTCAGYIASFLSRAGFVSLPLHVCASAQLLSQFLLAYIDATRSGGAEFADSQGSGAAVGSVSSSWGVGSFEHTGAGLARRAPQLDHDPDVEAAHAVFYSVCQALFYMLCFRHRQLGEMAGGADFLRGLQLPRIVMSPLNPLAVRGGCQQGKHH